MSSESITTELEDETLRATYTRLSVLFDAAQTLLEMADADLESSEWMKPMRLNLSKHNHKDLISDDDWRRRTLDTVKYFDKEVTQSLWFHDPFEPTFRLILSDMRESFEHPLVSR
ncbi:MAG: hypothetical protein TREMPRED_002117, partial [Tremellales sp. Tagirdzhanova-0007]